jgi:hypothetical protein
LLDAVREFLTGQVMPAASGQLAFHARVGANVLAIVARELELGAVPTDSDPVGLANSADPADPASLAADVARRLAVANPRYFGKP